LRKFKVRKLSSFVPSYNRIYPFSDSMMTTRYVGGKMELASLLSKQRALSGSSGSRLVFTDELGRLHGNIRGDSSLIPPAFCCSCLGIAFGYLLLVHLSFIDFENSIMNHNARRHIDGKRASSEPQSCLGDVFDVIKSPGQTIKMYFSHYQVPGSRRFQTSPQLWLQPTISTPNRFRCCFLAST
jgi:hypothetical protein